MTDQQHRDKIIAAVDKAFDEQTGFLADLVAAQTQRGQESSGQDLMEAAYKRLGLDVERWTLDPAELATHPGSGAVTVDYSNTEVVVGSTQAPTASGADAEDAGRSLIFNGHIDVVPVGKEELWTRDPYGGEIVDGHMYGRGVGDMKAGLSASVYALAAVQAAGLRPRGRVQLQSVPEEECTGNGSMSALLRGHTADAVVIPEPSGEQVVGAHLGVIWCQLTVRARAAHAATMSEGLNAIDAAWVAIGKLRELEEKWNAAAASDPDVGGETHPLNFNIGTFHAGDWPSSVPDACTVGIRVAYLPDVPAEDAFAELQSCVADAVADLDGVSAEMEKIGFFAQGYRLPQGTDAEAVLAGAHKAIAEAAGGDGPDELTRKLMAGYIDSRVFGRFADMPALVYGPLSERLHGADERVNLDSLRRVTKTLALFIADWCGVDEA
ncbi:ArgE/DapE family deacylase [Brevibacterium gallinarum]|uniref:ArgE/DapE family deacylase n=1 Tax=Brevibacterium gallinarum TaxID=2762220 RepID=A0ABR8WXT2_9MICO|nr:ArgE/DapE family deacylase [Brevibacterium gallinarum]MBD8021889.1 ArgE/DapE family deacylase [Brevibacterium gallinarum]